MATFKQIRRAARRPFETGGYRLAKALVPLLPRIAVVGVARLAGHLVALLPLREKRFALKNLDAVFGDTKSTAEKQRIISSSFRSFALTMMDLFWFSRNSAKRICKYVEITPEFTRFFEDKPQLLLTAHFGNWEFIAQTSALHKVDLASIAAPVKNKAINQIIIEQREKTGQTIIPQKGALRTLVTRLRNKGKVGFVLDQNTPEKEGGIVVDFLGMPTPVSAAPAALAYRTGTEILFGFCIPQPRGKYLLYSTGVLQPPPYEKTADSTAVARELTQQILDHISEEIRKRPEYWLWAYRHWRRELGKTYPPNYPNY